jgi:hypothetical protein
VEGISSTLSTGEGITSTISVRTVGSTIA